MTDLAASMFIPDADPTPTGASSGTFDPPLASVRTPELEAVRARLADELFGVALAGPKLGRFRLVATLGEGGMGRVFAADDEALGRRVAVKVLHDERARTAGGRARLLREAQALARLSHPNVVQIFEVGEQGAQVYVAMEYVAGQDLARWLAGGPRPWPAVLAAFVAAGHGLAAAHAAGLVHRDFKPANVIVGDDGRVRVLDFGLAHAPADGGLAGDPAAPAAALTMTGALNGTPVYLAPEVAAGGRADARSDQYSFCVALWEGLYARRPHRGETLSALMAAKRRGEVEPPPARRGVPGWLHAAVLRGLQADPAARWPSMAALLAELERDRRAPRRRARALASAAMLVAGLAVAGAGIQQATRAEDARAEEELRAIAAQDAADANARKRADVEEAHAAAARVRRALDLAATPAGAAEATRLATAALREADGAARVPALRALVTALGAPRLVAEARAPEALRAAEFAAGGRTLAAVDQAWTLHLWTDGAHVEVPRVHALRVAPDGAPVTVGADGLVVRDAATGAALRTLGPGVDLLELSPDGRLAAAVDGDAVQVWDLRSGARVARLPGAAHHAAFSGDGARLVTAAGGAATLWSLPDGRLLGRLPTDAVGAQAFTNVAISADGARVAVAGNDLDLHLWDTSARPRRLARAVGHRHVAFVLRFGDDHTLLSAGGDGQVFVWDGDDGRALLRLQAEDALWYTAAARSPDGRRIAGGDGQGVLRVWDAATGAPLASFSGERGELVDLRFSADGRQILTAAASGAVSVWALPDGVPPALRVEAPLADVDLRPGSDRALLLAPDGAATLRTLAADADVLALGADDAATRAPAAAPDAAPPRLLARLAPDGAAALTLTRDGLAELWDAATGARRCAPATRLHPDAGSAAFTDAATFAGVAADGTVHAWRSDDCREVATLSSAPRAAWMPWLVAGGGRALVLRHGRVHTLADPRGAAAPTELDLGAREPLTAAASPDGAQWTIVGREGLAVRRDARTGADLGGLAGLAGWVTGARYAPDGATLLTLGGGHAAHLWRAADGAPLARLEIGDTPVRAAFSADGERLLVADARGRVGLWDVATREFAGTLARLGGQPLLVAFSADDADALLAGPAGVVRVPATAAGVLAASAQAE